MSRSFALKKGSLTMITTKSFFKIPPPPVVTLQTPSLFRKLCFKTFKVLTLYWQFSTTGNFAPSSSTGIWQVRREVVATETQLVEARDFAKYLTMHSTVFLKIIQFKVTTILRLKNSAYLIGLSLTGKVKLSTNCRNSWLLAFASLIPGFPLHHLLYLSTILVLSTGLCQDYSTDT